MKQTDLHPYLEEKLNEAKKQFERTIDCKHTEFDDLYPYISEQPQFFWYKRYVAWQELLTLIQISNDYKFDWKRLFLKKQSIYIEKRVLDAKVLDNWYEQSTADSAH